MKQLWGSFLTLPLVASVVLTAIPSQTATLPTFEQYRVNERFTGKPVPINLNTPEIRRYRTVLRNAAKQKPNFAGRYIVATWGCGTSCQMSAIIDAKKGIVYMPGIQSEAGLKYRLNSRLLIVNPPEEIATYGANKPDWLISRYYVWQNDNLKQVYPPESN